MPNAGPGKHIARLQVQVEAGGVHIFGAFVPELGGRHDLVRALVLREANVPVNSEDRPTRRSRVSDEMRADLAQWLREVGDELHEGLANMRFVATLVCLEPTSVVV